MAQEGGGHVFPGDAAAVVGDADVGDAAVLDLHSDGMVAPASMAFSSSSLTTEAGRSTTSPAAISSARLLGEYLNVQA